MCTGSFVKTLIAQAVYLMLCGIRLIPHGTRLARVCIFRYTSAGSCHGLISYGTRRPRACGIPCVSVTRVPAGRASRTHEGRVCRPPANWGPVCTAGAPSGTRLVRVSCGRANSAQVCTGTQRRPYSWGPSLRSACKLGAGVYRRPSPVYSSGPSLRRPRKLAAGVYRGTAPPVLVRAEFTDPLQTQRGCVPGASAAPARTGGDIAEACKLGPGACPKRRRPRTHPPRPCRIL